MTQSSCHNPAHGTVASQAHRRAGHRELATMFVCAGLIPHLVGKSYAESVSALRWLCLITFFRCFHLSAGDAIAGAGHQSRFWP
jgi:hypothetical protein